MFIVVEGVDGSGKSTMVKRLHEYLESVPVPIVTGKEPGTTLEGAAIRDFVLRGRGTNKTRLMSMLAARAYYVDYFVKPLCKRGYWVLSDRFDISTSVYQGHVADRSLLTFIQESNRFIIGDLEVDLYLILDIDENEYRRRRGEGRKDEIEKRTLDNFNSIRKGYLMEAKRRNNAVVIDGSGDMDQVFRKCREAIRTAWYDYNEWAGEAGQELLALP